MKEYFFGLLDFLRNSRFFCCFSVATLVAATISLSGNAFGENSSVITFATCADYPPFEYYKNGKELVGFDIDLARLIAEKLNMNPVFKDMSYGSIVMSVKNKSVDAGIAAMEITEEKKKNFDFSREYHKSAIAMIYNGGSNSGDPLEIGNKNVACQLGCAGHEKSIRENAPNANVVFFDKIDTAIEALKAGHVEYVFLDDVPAGEFCKNNNKLKKVFIKENTDGYGILLNKGSPLKEKIDKALDELKAEGKIEDLRKKYLGK
jgi:polar amino acid transport system substrate-binding protein